MNIPFNLITSFYQEKAELLEGLSKEAIIPTIIDAYLRKDTE